MSATRDRRLARLAFLQGAYLIATGVWPLLSRPTFESVTGAKQDYWLVITVGLLAIAIGVSLIAGATTRVGRAGVTLGVTSAAAFGIADVLFSLEGTISRIYLLDAAVETLLIVLWLAALVAPARHLESGVRAPLRPGA
jgi:hypothetical protein